MIDRKARDAAIAAFEEYLDDRITAFEFDDRLQNIDTKDQTVRELVIAAWFHYDDNTDHKVRLNKPEWDYFQRLLLLLKSDAEVISSSKKRWALDHAIAWLGLILFVRIAFLVGWNYSFFIMAIPFGILSILIHRYRERIKPQASATEISLAPFSSYSQIRRLRQQVLSFSKKRYRAEIHDRKIRNRIEKSFNYGWAFILWLLFSPIVLFAQGFPDSGFMTIQIPQNSPKLS